MRNIPVVFIHRGFEPYVESTIRQAQHFGNDTILIGDGKNEHCKEFTKWDNMDKYFEWSLKFKDVYVPLSTLGDYELFCFQRWYILYEYMKEHNLDKVFYADTDVMLYCNVNDEWPKYKNFIFTLILKSVGCTSFFTFDGLKDFIKYMYNTFAQKGTYEYDKIASHFEVRQKHGLPGGVCDMTFLEYYGRYYCANGVGEMTFINDGAVFDHCVNQKDTFYEFENGLKKIQMKEGVPYVLNERTGELIRFNSFHFQGSAKGHIDQYKSYA